MGIAPGVSTGEDMPTISLTIIARDEQDMLPDCLASVDGACDEIVVVDTGSTDETPNIARAFGAKVGHFPWNDRFDDARNAALDLATGDWVFFLDADERLLPLMFEKIRAISQVPEQIQGAFFYCISPTPERTDVSPVLRMFRRLPHIRFEGRVHEEVGLTIQRAGGALAMTPVHFLHEGYRQHVIDSKSKWDRNERLLLLEDAERPNLALTQYNLGHHYLIQSKQGQDTQEKAAHYFRRGLELASPDQLFYGRLVLEAGMAGINIGDYELLNRRPADPMQSGLNPDPLQR